ncbi:hypothetical protein Vafri_4520 [Volvox africanus]|uniref:SET domain-containing protein n=1 Tax=Volvox africanus TaxID=51714 RepID=A0A8J4AYM9_9CHLO|nr:hypothetical protein Vafri_4520 [Volvox africanus]
MRHSVLRTWSADSAFGGRCRRPDLRNFHRVPIKAISNIASPFTRQQGEQAVSFERVIDGLEIDSLASLGFHGPDDIRGLMASEGVRNAALVTVPIGSTLAVSLDGDGGQLSVLAPPDIPSNVKKAIEVVAGLIRETPNHQLLILAVLLLWARKYGSTAWREYCEGLLPPAREMSCLLCYTPGELSTLQLPHFVDEAARQHDWARWAHSQWLSSSSGALRRLGLADALEDSVWALAVVRSRAVEFQMGMAVGSGSGSGFKAGHDSGPEPVRLGRGRRLPTGPVVSVLAPVVDLANHNNDPNCVIQLTTDKSRIVLLPRRPIRPGEPLTVDYGFDRSSLELMADYGFVTSANPYDGEVELPEADKLPSLELSRLEAAARALRRRYHPAAMTPRRQGLSEAAAAAEKEEDGRSSGGGKGNGGGGEERDVADEALATEEEEHEGVAVEEEDEVVISETAADTGAGDGSDFTSRLRAAVALLSPRTAPFPGAPANSGNFSTPATQRIIAGLWHKLIRHCIESLPTSLEQDRALLEDIIGGRVLGFAAGPSLSLDPGAMQGPTSAFEHPPRPQPPVGGSTPPVSSKPGAAQLRMTSERKAVGAVQGETVLAAATAAAGARDGVSGSGKGDDSENEVQGTDTRRRAGSATTNSVAAPPKLTHQGSRGPQDDSSDVEAVTAASAVEPHAVVGSSGGNGSEARSRHGERTADVICRTGRRAGRLYAAVRARVEHKEVLAVAEQLLVQYARN